MYMHMYIYERILFCMLQIQLLPSSVCTLLSRDHLMPTTLWLHICRSRMPMFYQDSELHLYAGAPDEAIAKEEA